MIDHLLFLDSEILLKFCFVFFHLEFCDHPNIIKLKDIIKPETPTGYHDIYLVMEFMEIDLDKTINSD